VVPLGNDTMRTPRARLTTFFPPLNLFQGFIYTFENAGTALASNCFGLSHEVTVSNYLSITRERVVVSSPMKLWLRIRSLPQRMYVQHAVG
jgi:hypothetical protein